MKHLTLLAVAACLFASIAHAQSPAPASPPSPEPTAAPAKDAPPAPDAKPAPEAEKPRLSEANCVRQTGSRITARDGKPRCNGLPGRAYTKDDIDRTGHTNLADALRALDPAIQ